jgi:hypothetical protein
MVVRIENRTPKMAFLSAPPMSCDHQNMTLAAVAVKYG